MGFLLLNLTLVIWAVTPLAGGFLVWKIWGDPSRVYVREVNRLERRINDALASGDAAKAHTLSYSLTALVRQKDPNAKPYVPDALRSLYDVVSDD